MHTAPAGWGSRDSAKVEVESVASAACDVHVFIERLWWSFKYEAVCLHEFSDGFHAQRVIVWWRSSYNTQRHHSVLADTTPAEL